MLNNHYFIKDINLSKKLYNATKTAIISLLIAILAYLELITPAFWLIFITEYFI